MNNDQLGKDSNTINIENDKSQIKALLNWADQYGQFAYLNPNGHSTLHGSFPHFLGAGCKQHIKPGKKALETLQQFLQSRPFALGYLTYDLKNEIHPHHLTKARKNEIPLLSFFEPEHLIQPRKIDPAFWVSNIDPQQVPGLKEPVSNPVYLQCTTSKAEYLHNAHRIREAIIDGAYYEINYCIEFTAEAIRIDPIRTYMALNEASPMPFSALFKDDNTYIICASPERFLKKQEGKLITQPIKGTQKRGDDVQQDQAFKKRLFESEKERAENMMIVDLMRNDLSKCAISGTVKVEELFGIYTFKNIHQMISTVACDLRPGIADINIISNTFPMGSMTGAPKIRVMQEIDDIEAGPRGIYSGALGYFTPEGNFDFNVIIRTIIYNASQNKLSFHVGSAITFDADPEQEYNECMLKAESMINVLRAIGN